LLLQFELYAGQNEGVNFFWTRPSVTSFTLTAIFVSAEVKPLAISAILLIASRASFIRQSCEKKACPKNLYKNAFISETALYIWHKE
jgi:hypothetical protein